MANIPINFRDLETKHELQWPLQPQKMQQINKEPNIPQQPLAPQTIAQTIHSRSRTPPSTQQHEISFQSQFLAAHISAFQQIFSKYCSIRSNRIPTCPKTPTFSLSLDHSPNPYKYIQQLIKTLDYLPKQYKLQLLQDWRHQQCLCQFLNIITQPLDYSFQCQIIGITCLIWEVYVAMSCKDLPGYRIMKSMRAVFLKSFFDSEWSQRFTCFYWEHNQGAICREACKEFISAYFQTIYLILQGYFNNPFSLQHQEHWESFALNSSWEERQSDGNAPQNFLTTTPARQR